MPTIIKGIYQNGKITFLDTPPKISKTLVYVQFVKIPPMPKQPRETKTVELDKFNPQKFRRALKNTFGAIPDLPDGIKYENQMRKKSNWERKYDW